MQISRKSPGTKELQRVSKRVVISPISFHLARMCRQSVDVVAAVLLDIEVEAGEELEVTLASDVGKGSFSELDLELDRF